MEKMVQYLWLGCVESNEEFKRKARKGYTLASAQVSQTNLINGLERVTGQVFDSINGSVLPPYPIYSERIIAPVSWEHCTGAFDISVGYKNDKYINRLYCQRAMVATAKQWIKERYHGDRLIVFAYSMRSGAMATACYIKKQISKAEIYLIVTDLPQFMDLGQSKLKCALKKIDWIGIKMMQSKFDGFVLYASKMADYLRIPEDRWLLMEGSFEGEELPPVNETEKKKAVMYSGKLDEQYGIPMLLDAFMEIEQPDAELWLTGGGNAEKYIEECAKKDQRIKYFGFLPSREDVLRLQQKARLLVNMRLPSEKASAYCFPSKLFEYMATGTPVLSFKLEGIPHEYYDYLIMVDENKDDLRNAIKQVLVEPWRFCQIGKNAKTFIGQKTSVQQAKKIVEWLRL